LDGDVLFTGQLPQSLAQRYVRQAAVLTSPRTEGTNTPLKVYEQLASGIPLVATRILSHTQVLSDDVCVLVDPTPESMANGICEALNDQERRQAVVSNARALYDERYSRPAYFKKIQDLLRVLS